METATIINKINEFLVEEFEIEATEIKPSAALRDALDLDSLDYIDLVVVLENNFGFKVKPEDFNGIDTIKSFYEYVIGRVAEKVKS